MAFKQLKTGDPDLDRVQGNILSAFDELALADDHNLNVVAVSSNYTCTGQEDVIALVSGNPTVTIQPAKKQKRKIILTAQGGSCTVQTPDRSFSAVVNTTSTLTLIPRPDGSGYWGL